MTLGRESIMDGESDELALDCGRVGEVAVRSREKRGQKILPF